MHLPAISSAAAVRPGRRTHAWRTAGATWAAAALLGACTQLPTAPVAAPPAAAPSPALGPGGIPAGIVSITYADPAQMSDARTSPRESASARRAWLDALCLYLADRAAPLLPPGQLLDVRLTDVQRAVRNAATPRIDLDFTLRTPGGRVLRQGQRQLRDMPAPARPAADPLAAEKALIDAWLRREFPARAG